MSPKEAGVLQAKEGGATNNWIKSKADAAGDKLVDQFTAEAKALVAANPMGSSQLEKTDHQLSLQTLPSLQRYCFI